MRSFRFSFSLIFLLTVLALHVKVVLAEGSDNRPKVVVASQAIIKKESVLLGDIAKITSSEAEYADLVNALKKVRISEAPPAGTNQVIIGAAILETIEHNGIPRDAFGYSIPRHVTLSREGRQLEIAELIQAAREQLLGDPALDIQIRDLKLTTPHIIPTGQSQLKITKLGQPAAGQLPLRVEVLVDEKPAARFMATAMVDDWREVPVLNKTIERGMLISQNDLQLIRLNVTEQPADLVANSESLIGRRARMRLGVGEIIRKNTVDIPPIIPKGKLVTMIYRIPGMQAKATGIALDDGFDGESVKIRNESSKKIVGAYVVNENEVEVRAQ